MFKEIGLASFIVASLSFAAAAEVIPGSQFNYGAWQGAGYTDDDTGQFTHCAISAGYVSGNELIFSVNADATVSVAVYGELGLRSGQQFPVALYVDRRPPFYGTAEALDADFAVLRIQEFEAAMTAFKKGYKLTIEALGGTSQYSLKGTFRALDEALKCALTNYEKQVAVAPETVDKTQLFQVSAIFLADMGVSDFRYLTEAELVDLGMENTVSWKADNLGLSGLFLEVPYNGTSSLRESDAEDTQFMARTCEGDYFTSARTLDLGERRREARELLLVCKEDSAQSETYLTKFLAGERVIYTLVKFSDLALESDSLPRKDKSASAVVKASAVVSE